MLGHLARAAYRHNADADLRRDGAIGPPREKRKRRGLLIPAGERAEGRLRFSRVQP
jgi:hypothetical protein